MLGVFGLRPDHDLDIMRAGQNLDWLTGELAAKVGAELRITPARPGRRPGRHDDGHGVRAGGLPSRNRVAHVEAGLRTGDPRDPFPEEMNRKIIGAIASWHFAPTRRAARNLKAEGVPPSRIAVTGNTVVDALLMMDQAAGERPLPGSPYGRDRG